MSTMAASCNWKDKHEMTYLRLFTHKENHLAGSLPCSHMFMCCLECDLLYEAAEENHESTAVLETTSYHYG